MKVRTVRQVKQQQHQHQRQRKSTGIFLSLSNCICSFSVIFLIWMFDFLIGKRTTKDLWNHVILFELKLNVAVDLKLLNYA